MNAVQSNMTLLYRLYESIFTFRWKCSEYNSFNVRIETKKISNTTGIYVEGKTIPKLKSMRTKSASFVNKIAKIDTRIQIIVI